MMVAKIAPIIRIIASSIFMVVVVRTVLGAVFVDNYTLDPVSGDLSGTKTSKTGRKATIKIPKASIGSIEEWEGEPDVDVK